MVTIVIVAYNKHCPLCLLGLSSSRFLPLIVTQNEHYTLWLNAWIPLHLSIISFFYNRISFLFLPFDLLPSILSITHQTFTVQYTSYPNHCCLCLLVNKYLFLPLFAELLFVTLSVQLILSDKYNHSYLSLFAKQSIHQKNHFTSLSYTRQKRNTLRIFNMLHTT